MLLPKMGRAGLRTIVVADGFSRSDGAWAEWDRVWVERPRIKGHNIEGASEGPIRRYRGGARLPIYLPGSLEVPG